MFHGLCSPVHFVIQLIYLAFPIAVIVLLIMVLRRIDKRAK